MILAARGADAAPPSKVEAVKALKKSVKDVKSVSQVFADLGEGRFPVLFVTRARHCLERQVDGEKEQNCSATTVPHAAILSRGSTGELQVDGELLLPTSAPPWDQPEELKWGIANVKDHDGDGKPELLVIYGYHGPTVWAVGDTYYRELCILNLDKLGVALQVTLDQKPQDSASLDLESRFKLLPGEVQLTRKVGDYDGAKGERVYKDEKVVWRWEAARDQFVQVNAKAPGR
jgi:hypothetical protein